MAAGRFRIPSLTVLAGGSPNGRRKDNRPNGRVLPGMARRIRKCTCRTGAVACSSSGTIAFSASATYGRKDAPKPAAKRATERRAASCRVHAAYANPAWYPRRHGNKGPTTRDMAKSTLPTIGEALTRPSFMEWCNLLPCNGLGRERLEQLRDYTRKQRSALAPRLIAMQNLRNAGQHRRHRLTARV